jgi:hypothetical protein
MGKTEEEAIAALFPEKARQNQSPQQNNYQQPQNAQAQSNGNNAPWEEPNPYDNNQGGSVASNEDIPF